MKDSEKSPPDTQSPIVDSLSIDTNLASAKTSGEPLDSQQSTPKAEVIPLGDSDITSPAQSFKPFDDPDLSHRNVEILSSLTQKEQLQSVDSGVEEAVTEAGLVSTLGYFASSPSHRTTEVTSNDELPSLQRQPSPVEPATKDRSSYLLQSSPISRNYDGIDFGDKNVDSPSGKQKLPWNALHSIQERQHTDIFGPSKEPLFDTQQDRERAFETLSGISSQERARGLANTEAQNSMHDDSEDHATNEENEPADEFVWTNSKKDKKKGEKKKVQSSSSWELEEDSVSQEKTRLLEELSLKTSREMPEPIAPSYDFEQDDRFPTPKPEKEKESDKNQKFVLSLGSEGGSELQTVLEPQLESSQLNPEESLETNLLEGSELQTVLEPQLEPSQSNPEERLETNLLEGSELQTVLEPQLEPSQSNPEERLETNL
jgi:hypothetical protein